MAGLPHQSLDIVLVISKQRLGAPVVRNGVEAVMQSQLMMDSHQNTRSCTSNQFGSVCIYVVRLKPAKLSIWDVNPIHVT